MKILFLTIERHPALLVEPAIVFSITLVIAYLIRSVFFAALRKATAKRQSRPGAILLESLRGPTHIWNFILALHLAIQSSALPPRATAIAPEVLQVLFIASLTMMFMRFAGEVVRHYGQQVTGAGAGATPVTSLTQNLAELAVLITGLLVILNAIHVEIAPILTALGVGGLAVALALQDTLSNLFAGFYISVSGQLRLGDYIKLNSGEEGYLADIGWRSTAIRAGANNMIIVPNNKLAQAIVTNFSLPDKRMGSSLQVMTGFDVDADRVEGILLEEAKKALVEVPGMGDGSPSVALEPTGDWSLVFTVSFQITEFGKQGAVKGELRKRILRRFQREGIELPYPARVVYLRAEGGVNADSPSSKPDGPSPSQSNPSTPA